MSEQREIARQVAGMVATELGDGWAVDTDPRWNDYAGVYVDGPEGARLFMRTDWRNTDRLEVSGDYPAGAYDATYPRLEACEIGVKRDRGPYVIAREITRRLLPKYLPELERARAGIARATVAADAQAAAAGRLVALLPLASLGRYHNQPTTDHMSFHRAGHDGYGNVTLHHDGAKGALELHSAPFGLLEAIAKVIGGWSE